MVARHGRTAWNAAGRFQGMGDPPLDEVGEAQAAVLGAELAPLRPRWVASSDLQRAARTGEVVAAACGVDLRVDAGLREVDLGAWEGLTRTEVEARYPDEYRRWSAGEDVRRGGGETRAEAAARFVASLLALAAPLHPGDTGVVVAHGIVIQAALDAMCAAGLLASPDLSAGAPHLGNGAWLALEIAAPVG
ncbi:histidine phosphatase family protein [Acidiferrimicrobium sp. IK]|uniref:histidine phosphatase family protein n=1 Tax=Acidiferrimicrobium sp. IK TaxID=2871700 RepID=UPI0021CB3E20|nr:histidine phosphatase family protein [Acidiferrimicrobium sp. IK]